MLSRVPPSDSAVSDLAGALCQCPGLYVDSTRPTKLRGRVSWRCREEFEVVQDSAAEEVPEGEECRIPMPM